jgi:hypothetical protein
VRKEIQTGEGRRAGSKFAGTMKEKYFVKDFLRDLWVFSAISAAKAFS